MSDDLTYWLNSSRNCRNRNRNLNYDYSNRDGCCLSCPNKKPGCLCYECKCTKCYWYRSKEEGYNSPSKSNQNGFCALCTDKRLWRNP